MSGKKFDVKKENFSEWYNQVVRKAELIDDRYGVKGFYVRRPRCVSASEEIIQMFVEELEGSGHEPVLFPSVIPEENLRKEEEHVEGFSPEVFWVNEAGDKELNERLALTPTSETAFYPMYSLWIEGHTDLPLKLYQKRNTFRYETKATKPLLREREFIWLEAHDAFESEEEALDQVDRDTQSSKKIIREKLGVPILIFRRPYWDKFSGAVDTFAADCLMPDGKTLQLPSTHFLGKKFSRDFDITYEDEDGENKHPYITCYGPGISRILGSVISIHGDDNGLVFPLSIAPTQVTIVPIFYGEEEKEEVKEMCFEVKEGIDDKYRVDVDLSEDTPGEKFFRTEFRGVPIRIEIGQDEVEEGKVTLKRRKGDRVKVDVDNLKEEISEKGDELLEDIKSEARAKQDDMIVQAKEMEEMKKSLEDEKMVKVPFCSISEDGVSCAEEIKEEANADVRGVNIGEEEEATGDCVVCDKDATEIVYVAKSY